MKPAGLGVQTRGAAAKTFSGFSGFLITGQFGESFIVIVSRSKLCIFRLILEAKTAESEPQSLE
jgi:hypothetical protein